MPEKEEEKTEATVSDTPETSLFEESKEPKPEKKSDKSILS